MKAVPESPPQSVVSDPSSQRAAVAEMVGRSASSDSGRGKRAEIPEKVRALFSSVEAAAAATADGSAGGLLRTHSELEAELVGGHGPAGAAPAAAAGVPDVREQALQDQLEQMAARLQQRDAENQRLLEERNLAKAAALESREQLLSLSAEISAEAIERERCQSPVELSRPPLRPSPLRWIEAGTPPRIAPAHSDGRTSPDSFSAFSERSDPGSSFSGRAERTPVRTPVSRTSGSRTGSDVASASDITESDCTALTLHDIRGGGAAKPANIEKLSKLRLSDFDVICTIGHGPNGKVMRVQKKDDGAVFALKSIKRRRLLNEYDALGKLSRDNSLWRVRCPFVTRLHFAFESLSRIHLIVDAVDGGQLLLHLRQHWPAGCPEAQARFHAAEIVLGLEHLHAHGVTHGDLKSENVLVDRRGHVVLTDFGCAAEQADISDISDSWDADDPHPAVVAARYRAPELLRGERWGKGVDWWGLGVLLHEMLSGEPPHTDANQLRGLKMLQPQRIDLPRQCSGGACSIVQMLLQPRIEQRLGSGERGSVAVRSHQFFSGLDWAAMLAKREEPPFAPGREQIRQATNGGGDPSSDDDELLVPQSNARTGAAQPAPAPAAAKRADPCKVFVGGIGAATSSELRAKFRRFGKVSSAEAMVSNGGVPRGFGFVVFEAPAAAERAITTSRIPHGKATWQVKACQPDDGRKIASGSKEKASSHRQRKAGKAKEAHNEAGTGSQMQAKGASTSEDASPARRRRRSRRSTQKQEHEEAAGPTDERDGESPSVAALEPIKPSSGQPEQEDTDGVSEAPEGSETIQQQDHKTFLSPVLLQALALALALALAILTLRPSETTQVAAPGEASALAKGEVSGCAAVPCANGGTCVAIHQSRKSGGGVLHQCRCPPGATGSSCELDIDECASQPCQHGGTCRDSSTNDVTIDMNTYLCTCARGWEGRDCIADVDECATSPCRAGQVCKDSSVDNAIPIGHFICDDAPRGRPESKAAAEGGCASQPCAHGGTCRASPTDGAFECICAPDRRGEFCEFLVVSSDMAGPPLVDLGESWEEDLSFGSHLTLTEEELDLDKLLLLAGSSSLSVSELDLDKLLNVSEQSDGHDDSEEDDAESTATECPYRAETPAGMEIATPCGYEKCISHSDGCECLLFQWHYCSQENIPRLDGFCASFLAGIEDGANVLQVCMDEVRAGPATPGLDLDLSRPPKVRLWTSDGSVSKAASQDLGRVSDGGLEVVIRIEQPGKLGIRFVPNVDGTAEILAVSSKTASAHPALEKGLTLRGVAGRDLHGVAYKDALSILKEAAKTRPLSLAFARKATKPEPAQTACQPGQSAEEGGGCADCPPDTFDHDRNPDTPCRPCGALTPHAPPRSTVPAAESPGWSPALDAPLTSRNDAK